MAHGLEQQFARRDDFLYLDVSDPRDAEATERLGFTSTPHFFFLRPAGPVVETIQRVVPRGSVAGALERLAGTAAP